MKLNVKKTKNALTLLRDQPATIEQKKAKKKSKHSKETNSNMEQIFISLSLLSSREVGDEQRRYRKPGVAYQLLAER